MYVDVPLESAYRLFGNGRTVLLTTYDRDLARPNVMTCAWSTVVAKMPPLLGFVVAREHHTYALARRETEFVVNVPPREMARLALAAGAETGATADKFIALGIDALASKLVIPPSIHGSLAHLECKLDREIDLGDAALLVGRVVACRALEGTFAGGAWNFHDPRVSFLHHLGDDRFAVSAESIKAS